MVYQLPNNICENVPLPSCLDPTSKQINIVCAIRRLIVGDTGGLIKRAHHVLLYLPAQRRTVKQEVT